MSSTAATFGGLILRMVLAVTLAKPSLGYIGIWMAWPIGSYRTSPWSEKHAPQQLAEAETEA